MVLPVIILVLGLLLQAVAALGIQLSNAALARQAAQQLSQGVAWGHIATLLAQTNALAEFTPETHGERVCVEISQPIGPGPLQSVLPQVSVTECVFDAR